ncbi:MAG: hypothetical protein ACKVZH_01420 [Blastocatellia bacterium]
MATKIMTPRKLLWVDGLAGATVGVAMLLLERWLRDFYQLPLNLYLLISLANLAYGCYSLTLASRAKRPKFLILLLIVANLTWAALCARWVFVYATTASFFGLAHLLAEALFVGGLACVEWRWREQLQTT